MNLTKACLRSAFSVMAFWGGVSTAVAQAPQPVEAVREFETRAQLEAQAKEAEAQHRTSEAWLLRTRLEEGDFQEGDRIIVMLETSAASQRIDTIAVRAGKILQLPRMADLSLDGVLRSELNERLVKHLAQYLKDPGARTTPLLRVAVLGSVGRQGFYYTSADLPLTELVMKAGGPAGDEDLNKMIIRRGTDVIWSAQATQTAVHDGLSLDRLHLRAGDEVFIPARRNFSWTNLISVTLGSAALLLSLARLW